MQYVCRACGRAANRTQQAQNWLVDRFRPRANGRRLIGHLSIAQIAAFIGAVRRSGFSSGRTASKKKPGLSARLPKLRVTSLLAHQRVALYRGEAAEDPIIDEAGFVLLAVALGPAAIVRPAHFRI